MLARTRSSDILEERAPEFRARYNALDAEGRADMLRALSPERSREPVLRHLALGLTDRSALVRSVALTAFGFNRESEFGDIFSSEPWVEQLFTAAARTAVESLLHPDGHLRWAAARALRMPGRFIAVHMGEIVRLTRRPQRKERREGVFVLDRLFWEGRFGAERAFDPPTPAPDHLLPHLATIEAVLTERSKDEDPTVRLVVADVFAAMGRLAVRNLGVVRSLRADADERVRHRALVALLYIHPERFVVEQALAELLRPRREKPRVYHASRELPELLGQLAVRPLALHVLRARLKLPHASARLDTAFQLSILAGAVGSRCQGLYHGTEVHQPQDAAFASEAMRLIDTIRVDRMLIEEILRRPREVRDAPALEALLPRYTGPPIAGYVPLLLETVPASAAPPRDEPQYEGLTLVGRNCQVPRDRKYVSRAAIYVAQQPWWDSLARVPPVLPQDRPAVVAFLEKYDLSALVALRLIAREGRSAVWALPEIRRVARAYFAPAGPEEPVDIKAELTEEARRLLALLEAR